MTTTKQIERGRVFSADEIRAFLHGTKTQFREAIMHQGRPLDDFAFYEVDGDEVRDGDGNDISSPYPVGSRIWVKETWVDLMGVSPATDEPNEWGDRPFLRVEEPTQQSNGRWHYDGLDVIWRADGDIEFCDGDGFTGDMADKSDMTHWKSSTCMPRKYSRLLLEVESVKAERLQDISEADARAEGVTARNIFDPANLDSGTNASYRMAFADCWNSVNNSGGRDWRSNPWVWVYEVKRVGVK